MRIETKCVQSGYTPENGEPRVIPIVQSTTYSYDSAEHVSDLFNLSAAGHMYTRISNPTASFVEGKIAELEKGVGALLTSSGQSATLVAIMTICKSGDHLITSSDIYGGTTNLFFKTLKDFGIIITSVSSTCNEEELNNQIRPNTKAIFGETLSNPTLKMLDIETFSKVAKKHNIPLIIDNTFPTPILCNPIDFGANIIIHSTSKYLDGHAVSLGGVVVDCGNFDWSSGKFPDFTTPDESYHGLKYHETFAESAFIVKARTHIMRDIGCCISPQNAFLLNLGLETLHLRISKHSENAMCVAEYLEKQDLVKSVLYPGLKSYKYSALSEKYMNKQYGGVLSFELIGDEKTAMKFINSLKMVSLVVHVCDIRTSILHPASTTHRQLSATQLQEQNISNTLLRLSVGIENVDDIIEDLEFAFSAVK